MTQHTQLSTQCTAVETTPAPRSPAESNSAQAQTFHWDQHAGQAALQEHLVALVLQVCFAKMECALQTTQLVPRLESWMDLVDVTVVFWELQPSLVAI